MNAEQFKNLMDRMDFPADPEDRYGALGVMFGWSRSTAYRAVKNGCSRESAVALLMAADIGWSYEKVNKLIIKNQKALS